jgi:hypothetical protein
MVSVSSPCSAYRARASPCGRQLSPTAGQNDDALVVVSSTTLLVVALPLASLIPYICPCVSPLLARSFSRLLSFSCSLSLSSSLSRFLFTSPPRSPQRYISCDPNSLLRDMRVLALTHEVARFAFLDHFPYTKHVECAVLLVKRRSREKVSV